MIPKARTTGKLIITVKAPGIAIPITHRAQVVPHHHAKKDAASRSRGTTQDPSVAIRLQPKPICQLRRNSWAKPMAWRMMKTLGRNRKKRLVPDPSTRFTFSVFTNVRKVSLQLERS